MNKNIKNEISISVGILVLSIICIFLPKQSLFYTWIHLLFIFSFMIFAFLILKTKGVDEREDFNRIRSSDLAFITGGLFSGIAIMYQILINQHIDIWIIIILISMVAARLLGQIWYNTRY